MNKAQRIIGVTISVIAAVVLVVSVIRAVSPKEHYYEWAEPGNQAAPTGGQTAGDQTAEQLMLYMDTDGDGYITMAEAPEELKASFSFIDTNGDGGIDVEEAQVMADYNNQQSARGDVQ